MTSAPFSTPSPEQPTARSPLRRSGTEKMFGGVCGGLAEYSGIDPVLWRVGMVALTVAGGAGVIVYLLLWVLLPPAPADPSRPDNRLDQAVDSLHEKIAGSRGTPPAA